MDQISQSVVYQQLKSRFEQAGLLRPLQVDHYEEGTELVYAMQSVADRNRATVHLRVEKFVGGGFAGQVYRVRVTAIDSPDNTFKEIEIGRVYAVKILIPPSRFSRIFRNLLYWIGFQGPFQLQVNPAAARAGALWQKLIRRGAKTRFGSHDCVVDIYATCIDENLGSCGELSEWVEGRTWRLEVDDKLDALKRWRKGKPVRKAFLGSKEYRTKYRFMHDFVNLLHDMGGHEFARQYEWSTCKSQPNCLKRTQSGNRPYGGLTAVDFRAGLVLLPFLPMSPGDFALILKGIARGSLVQFDRGNLATLRHFIETHADGFADVREMFGELLRCEAIYRNSIPDLAHHHLQLLYSPSLWHNILTSAVTGWKIRNFIDDAGKKKLDGNQLLKAVFYLIGAVPIVGRFVLRLFAHQQWRRHYRNIFTSPSYLKNTLQAGMAEKMIAWHRAERFDDQKALKISASPWRFAVHLPFSMLPVGLHRFLTDGKFAREKLHFIFVRPVKLYFDPEMREEWFREMVEEGQAKNILEQDDAEQILSQIKEPYIQKYLKSLAVHVCTLPVTQVVSVMVAVIFVLMHPEMPRSQAWGIGLGIIALFQVVPLSPGSLVRGLYVLYLVVKERNFKDYNIAVFLGFFKYIGYLAFPIQMAYRYPLIAGFMAEHWATQAVHIVPVFGESGALLEHWVFGLFYNWPLTLRRRITRRIELRAGMQKRFWHIGGCVASMVVLLGLAEFTLYKDAQTLAAIKPLWWLAVPLSVLCGAIVTTAAGGASLWERIVGASLCGVLTGILYSLLTVLLPYGFDISPGHMLAPGIWRVFIFTIFATLGAFLTELAIPDPELKV